MKTLAVLLAMLVLAGCSSHETDPKPRVHNSFCDNAAYVAVYGGATKEITDEAVAYLADPANHCKGVSVK